MNVELGIRNGEEWKVEFGMRNKKEFYRTGRGGEEVTGRGETGRWEKTEIKLIYIPFVSQVNNKDIGIDQHVFLPTPTFGGQK